MPAPSSNSRRDGAEIVERSLRRGFISLQSTRVRRAKRRYPASIYSCRRRYLVAKPRVTRSH
jgi:hypothetical protein